MKGIRIRWLAIIAFLLAATSVYAGSGDDITVARARKDYKEALRSKDIGRINAMKVELEVQLAKAQKRNGGNTTEKTRENAAIK